MSREILDAIEKIGKGHEEYKKVNDDRLVALEKGRDAHASELKQTLDKINAELTDQAAFKRKAEVEAQLQKERIEELEARAKTPGRTVAEKRQAEYKTTFVEWVRQKGMSASHEAKMHDIAKQAFEAKDITIGTPASGGLAVPEEISREIEKLERLYSPVRDLVKVVQAGTSDYKELVNIRGATSGWVGESGTRSATATPLLRERQPTHGELYAYPQVSEWSLDDIFFDVEAWLAEEVADAFAQDEGEAVIRGDGSNKPTGLLNTTPVATADFASPLRAAGAYQFVPSVSVSSPAAAEVTGDALIDLIYSLNARYRAGATFTMNSNTVGAVRKLKDGNGQYLWQPGLQLGQPDRLLGYQMATWEQMDNIATNAFPIGFGNYRRAYVMTDRVGMRITRDQVTNVGYVRFYVRRREGGTVLNNDALKFLRTTLS